MSSSRKNNGTDTVGSIFLGFLYLNFKPRANGRNIVGQQLPALLDATCCVRLHTQFKLTRTRKRDGRAI